VERWRVTRLGNDKGPPVQLTHIGSITGHDGDPAGVGAWTFTEKLNGAMNGIAPLGPFEFFFTQFLDEPVSVEGAGSGVLEGFVASDEGLITRVARSLTQRFSIELHAKMLFPRLRRSRIWHCHCAIEPELDSCSRMACGVVTSAGKGVSWNGIAFLPATATGNAASRGFLYVNDIHRRLVVEFGVAQSGAVLTRLREFRAPFLVDNVHVDTNGEALWIGAPGTSHLGFFASLAALQVNASAAHAAARAAGKKTPRPHLHLRPHPDAAPRPAMTSAVLRIDLATGEVGTRLMQGRHLAGISWGYSIAGRLFMASPFDDGVLVCPEQ